MVRAVLVSVPMVPLWKGLFRLHHCFNRNQERKISPQEEDFGTDIPRTSGGHSRGYPGPKLRSGRSKSWKKKPSIWARTSMTQRRGRPRPQGTSKNLGQKNFGLKFRSLRKGRFRFLRNSSDSSSSSSCCWKTFRWFRFRFRFLLRAPNGVFQTVFFWFLTSAQNRGKPLQRDKECLKTPVFSSMLVPSALADPDRPLNAPLWKTPFRKHRLLLLGSGICKRGWRKGVSLICSDLFWKQIGRKRSKSEQIGTNRGIPENKERKSEQIGRKRGNRNKSEQIGVTPFCRPQIGGSGSVPGPSRTCFVSGHAQPQQGTQICNFGARLHWNFWITSSRFFLLFQSFLCNVTRKSPQRGENDPISGQRRMCKVLSRCHFQNLLFAEAFRSRLLSVNSPALILSKDSGVSLAKIG